MKTGPLNICSLFILLLLFLSSVPPAEAADLSYCGVILEPKVTSAQPGDEFSITVSIDPGSVEVYGIQYYISYDPNTFEMLSQSKGPFLSQDGQSTFAIRKVFPDKGEVLYAESRYGVRTGVSSGGVASTIEFKVKDSASCGSPGEFLLTDVIIVDSKLQIASFEASNGTVMLTEPVPSEPLVISYADLFPATTTPGSAMELSVNVAGGPEGIEVAAGGVLLAGTNGVWQGSITAPSSPGDYSLLIKASGADGKTAEASVPYHVVLREGGVSISISPKASQVASGNNVSLAIQIKNTQNIDDTINIGINTDGLPVSYCADLSGFSWTEKEVKLRAGEEKSLQVEFMVPAGTAAGINFFRVNAKSESSTVYGLDTGYLIIT